MIITPEELADLHATYEEALPNLCTITNPARPGQDPVILTDVPCCILRPTQGRLGSGREPISRPVGWTVTVPLGTDVRTNALIEVDTGRHFRAGEIIQPASYSHCIYVSVTETTP